MIDPKCRVKVGTHHGPYFKDNRQKDFTVCSRHMAQYEERASEFGPFDWQELKEGK